MSDLILEKANKILIEKRLAERTAFHKDKRNKRIIEAGICPECGEPLVEIDKYAGNSIEGTRNYCQYHNIPYEEKHYWFYSGMKGCSKDGSHFFEGNKIYFDYDD